MPVNATAMNRIKCDTNILNDAMINKKIRVAFSRGFTLIEVLVSVFILSIGTLSVGAMQLATKRSNFESVQRTTAVVLANEIIERMRSNSGALPTYTDNGTGRTLSGSTMSAVDCTGAAVCDAVNLALYDLYQWEQALNGVAESSGAVMTGGLSAPTACINIPAGGADGFVNVAIAWRGMTRLSDPVTDNCGGATGLYDDGATPNVYRRVLVVRTFIF